MTATTTPIGRSMGQRLRINQAWIRVSDETVWTVRQVHRKDKVAQVDRDGHTILVAFREMRALWRFLG